MPIYIQIPTQILDFSNILKTRNSPLGSELTMFKV